MSKFHGIARAESGRISSMLRAGGFTLLTCTMVLSILALPALTSASAEADTSVEDDRAYAEAFEEAVDPKKLADLRLLRVDPRMKSTLESEKNMENFSEMAKLYGAEEMTERIVLYELDGRTFMGGFGL